MTLGRRRLWGADAGALLRLAWPVFIGQIALIGFSTVDTVLAARSGTEDLAALAVGYAAYITTFIGLAGVVFALSPIVGELFGAGKPLEAGRQLHQAVWLALGLSVPGCALLLWPGALLILAQSSPPVAAKVHSYLGILALALPAALLFGAYRGFNNAISRPKAVMVLQLGGFAAKLPLSALLVFGIGAPGDAWHLPAMGVAGCAWSTTLVLWGQLAVALLILRRDPFYRPFGVPGRVRLQAPQGAALLAMLRLGLPMAAALWIEVSGFTLMAVFIARLGTAQVAGHQIASNMVALLFMLPLSLGHAASVLVAQAIGAGRLMDARRLGWHGLELGVVLAAAMGLIVWLASGPLIGLYTPDPQVAMVALGLFGFMTIFHVADAAQTLAAFVLRAWRITTVPMLVYGVAVWGVGLGGGYLLVFSNLAWVPAGWASAQGYWLAALAGYVLTALALTLWLLHTLRRAG
ncbi:MAG: MATE family efflux transporter [Burkholderiales bacterium]